MLLHSFRSRKFVSLLSATVSKTALVISVLTLVFSAPANAGRYIVIDLDALSDYGTSSGEAINNAGEVAGGSDTGDGTYDGFLYAGGYLTDIAPGADSIAVCGLNLQRDIVLGDDFAGNYIPYSSGSITPLQAPSGGVWKTTHSINDAGQIVGTCTYSVDPFYRLMPSRHESNGGVTSLGYIGGYDNGADIPHIDALSVNKHGDTTGYCIVSDQNTGLIHAFAYLQGTQFDLQTGSEVGSGTAINSAGHVAGTAFSSQVNSFCPAYWLHPGQTVTLPSLSGYNVAGINDSDEIIGYTVDNFNNPTDPFIFGSNTSHLHLNSQDSLHHPYVTTPGWTLNYISAINASGQITGFGDINGLQHAYLASPFWRQADGPNGTDTGVPSKFGVNGNSSMVGGGCVLCAVANLARSLIGLHPLQDHVDIITPQALDQIYTLTSNAYTGTNNLTFKKVLIPLSRYAHMKWVTSYPVTQSNLNDKLTQEIYQNGRRVLLEFNETTQPPPPKGNPTSHTVWVVGKDGTDWKVADGGWLSAPSDAIGSLNAHYNGFNTASTSGNVLHTFTPAILHVYKNLDYNAPALLLAQAVQPATSNDDQLDQVSATIGGIAEGPVELVITDPQGRRLGHDVNTNTNFTEIPDGSYLAELPVGDYDDNGNPPDVSSPSRQFGVRNAVTGTYTVTATGTDTGAATVDIQFQGPGGAARNVQMQINAQPGQMVTQTFQIPAIGTADLNVTQASSPTTAMAGSNLTYTITVMNNGPDTATSPTLTDILPESVTFISASSDNSTLANSGNTVSGTLGDIPSGGTTTVTIVVTPAAAGTLTNSATVNAFEIDPNPADNTATISTVVGITYDAWLKLYFTPAELADSSISGPNADPDGDGVPNLFEYAQNTNPRLPDATPLSPSLVLDDNNNSYLAISYKTAPGVADLSYTTLISNDLINWTPTNLQLTGLTNNPDGSQTITLRDSVPVNQLPRRFIRLQVTQQ